ncbi:MAG TPA: DUF3108 domain-containing protein [Ideonella sp.]|uniref:DUF3108 domain-containing protein n=1 Tax=Ideonella sp. TaxID=1929293 RepID=UPI002E37E2A6|nr:DUF3108 domain-containing protein [Ideonella sp.]HEX5686698.1 DUF3108 domain-containing protein [Ideonella sp.]
MSAALPGGRSSRARAARRAGWFVLLITVSIGHWWLAAQLPDSRLGEGDADDAPSAIEVAFVRELQPAAPPVYAAAPSPPVKLTRAPRRPEPAASAASPPASEPTAEVAAVTALPASATASAPVMPASAPLDLPPVVAAASAPASAAAVVAAPASSAVTSFDWPPSTRLNYDFNGYYRGPVLGNAKVEWLRDGSHYQVRLEVRVPMLGGRKMLSDGQLGPNGLMPRRYDEVTDRLFADTVNQTVRFEADRIVLANQKVNDWVPGVQDTASQFVQMTWMFLTQPELLQVGRTIEFPLALPRRVGRWTYDVREQVTLYLPFGEVNAFHLEPRPMSKRGKEWLVDMWIAPSLQYLPARILLRQDAESYGELILNSRPLQSGPAPTPAAPRASERIVH